MVPLSKIGGRFEQEAEREIARIDGHPSQKARQRDPRREPTGLRAFGEGGRWGACVAVLEMVCGWCSPEPDWD